MTNFGRRRSTAADRSLGGLLLGFCLAAAASGCAQRETTPVARGEYYAAGKPDYDEFFVKLYRHQLDTANALKLEQAARDELARATGAAPNAKANELGPNLQKMAVELEQAGVEVTVPARAGAEGAPEIEVRGEPKGSQVAQVEAVRGATRKLLGLEQLAQNGGPELDALRTRSIELDREVDRVFWTDGAGKRAEVKNNLSDARELIALMNDSRKGVQQSSTELLAVLQVTFKAKAPPPAAEADESEPAPGKKKGRASSKRASAGKKGNAKAKPGTRAPAKPARSPAEATAPAAKPAPAPKPAPKAEFEP